MCYTGKCEHEGYMGDCTLPPGTACPYQGPEAIEAKLSEIEQQKNTLEWEAFCAQVGATTQNSADIIPF